jgi:hypothetical protein
MANYDDQAKQSWCSSGNLYRKQLDDAKRGLTEAEKRRREAELQTHCSRIGIPDIRVI